MAAGDGKGDLILTLNMDTGKDGLALQRLDNIGLAGIGKGTVVFAQLAAKTPLLIHIYTLHTLPSLFTCMENAQDLQFLVCQPNPTEH